MSKSSYNHQKNLQRDQKWSGVSKHKAKGKSGNSGLLPKNGQIEQVWIESITNRPGWVRRQYL